MIKRVGQMPFHQWEIDRQISIENIDYDEINWHNTSMKEALKTEPSSIIVVPNILLQEAENIYVYLLKNEQVVCHTSFGVCPRPKPEDYIYTETEHFTYINLEDRIKKLEESQGSGGVLEGEIDTDRIADGAVTEEKLSKELSEKLNKDATFEIGDGDIITEKIADNAITKEKIQYDLLASIEDVVVVTDDMATDEVITINLARETKEVVIKTTKSVEIVFPEDYYMYWRVFINTTQIESSKIDVGFSKSQMFGTDFPIIYPGKIYMIVCRDLQKYSDSFLLYEVDPITRLPIDEEFNALVEELHSVVTGGDTNE